jgi:hypothetical protein
MWGCCLTTSVTQTLLTRPTDGARPDSHAVLLALDAVGFGRSPRSADHLGHLGDRRSFPDGKQITSSWVTIVSPGRGDGDRFVCRENRTRIVPQLATRPRRGPDAQARTPGSSTSRQQHRAGKRHGRSERLAPRGERSCSWHGADLPISAGAPGSRLARITKAPERSASSSRPSSGSCSVSCPGCSPRPRSRRSWSPCPASSATALSRRGGRASVYDGHARINIVD